MRDSISIPIVQALHPSFSKDCTEYIDECEDVFDITLRVVQGGRTFEYQDSLYAKGRTVIGENANPDHPMGDIVTNSPGGYSYHNYWLAVDVVPIIGNKANWKFNYERIVNIASQWTITWGGNFPGKFKDYDHFEQTNGYTIQQLLAKYKAGEFIPGTKFVKL